MIRRRMMGSTEPEALSLLAMAAAVLHGNGQQTAETNRAMERLEKHYGVAARTILGWDSLIAPGKAGDGHPSAIVVDVTPTNVAMNRVVAASRAIEQAVAQRLPIAELQARLARAAILPPYPDHPFALAAAAGAVALSVMFGVNNLPAIVLISLSATAGAYVRRFGARHGASAFVETFLAALLAGIFGGYGVGWNISSDLRLIAVCPCMVLVPGPHILNGTLDLLGARISLASARLGFAGLILAAICIGLLAGLTLCGTNLPVAPLARGVSLWSVVIAAGVGAACYGIFFSLPLRFLAWPMGAAIVANATRWLAMTSFAAGPVLGAGLAGLVSGVILVPVSRHHHLPFAGVGFASIVSLLPGALLFRMAAGLVAVQTAPLGGGSPLLAATVVDGTTAILIIAAITIGVVIPQHLYDALGRRTPVPDPD
jgi:uncharacterized membrane protein YjjP (DUF1212 family)